MVEGGLGKLKYVSRVGKKLVKGTGAVYQICESVKVILERTPSRPNLSQKMKSGSSTGTTNLARRERARV